MDNLLSFIIAYAKYFKKKGILKDGWGNHPQIEINMRIKFCINSFLTYNFVNMKKDLFESYLMKSTLQSPSVKLHSFYQLHEKLVSHYHKIEIVADSMRDFVLRFFFFLNSKTNWL